MGEIAKQAAGSFASSMTKGIAAVQSAMVASGKNLVQGLWQGISGASGWLYKSVSEFASGIVKNIKGTLGIHSPSRVMRDEIGKNLSLGIGEGITRSAQAVSDAMRSVVDKLRSDAEGIRIGVGASAAFLSGAGSQAPGSGAGTAAQVGSGDTYITNFHQTNNSPKALSRLEVYRQTKNALQYAAVQKG